MPGNYLIINWRKMANYLMSLCANNNIVDKEMLYAV